jgi:hypothetical protein
MLLKDLAKQAESARHRLFQVAAQLRPNLEITAYHADQANIREVDAGSFCSEESFGW